MGQYHDVSFEAELNELGLEVWADLKTTGSWAETAGRMSYYGFLEQVERAGTWITPVPLWPGKHELQGNKLSVEGELKDRGGDMRHLLTVFLSPLVTRPFEVTLKHEVSDWKPRTFTIEPTTVKPDYDRRYGDPT